MFAVVLHEPPCHQRLATTRLDSDAYVFTICYMTEGYGLTVPQV